MTRKYEISENSSFSMYAELVLRFLFPTKDISMIYLSIQSYDCFWLPDFVWNQEKEKTKTPEYKVSTHFLWSEQLVGNFFHRWNE